MISSTSKTLLKNLIKHTDAHNRIVEESEMWKCYTLQQEQKHKRYHSPHHRGVQSTVHQVPRAHMDRDLSAAEPIHDSNYWKRKLQEMEEKDPDRWGHAGYKELYPEQFLSDSSLSSFSSSGDSNRKRSKYKRRKVEKSHKKKKKHKHKEKKRKKHRSRKNSTDSQWVIKNIDSESKH